MDFITLLRRLWAPYTANALGSKHSSVPCEYFWAGTSYPSVLRQIEIEAAEWTVEVKLGRERTAEQTARAAHTRKAPHIALQQLYRAYAIRRLSDSSIQAKRLEEIAWELGEIQQYSKAIEIATLAYAERVEKEQLLPIHPRFTTTLGQIAQYSFYLGDLDASLDWVDKALSSVSFNPMRGLSPELDGLIRFQHRLQQAAGARQALKLLSEGLTITDRFPLIAFLAPDVLSKLKSLWAAASSQENYTSPIDVGQAPSRLAGYLHELGLWHEAAEWFGRAARSASQRQDYKAAVDALIRQSEELQESGKHEEAEHLVTAALNDNDVSTSPMLRARLYGELASCMALPEDRAISCIVAAFDELKNAPFGELLDWASHELRLLVRFQVESLARKCFELLLLRLPDNSYYSPGLADMFMEIAHSAFKSGHWTEAIVYNNEALNRAFSRQDYAAQARCHMNSAWIFRETQETEFAERSALTAYELMPLLTDESLIRAIRQMLPTIVIHDGLQKPPSTRQHYLNKLLRTAPWTAEFVDALLALQDQVTQIEHSENPEYGFKLPFVLRSYAEGLDLRGTPQDARSYLLRSAKEYKKLRDYRQVAVSVHEYAVAVARMTKYISCKRAFHLALIYKRRYGSLTGHHFDSLLGYIKACMILNCTDTLATDLRELEAALTRSPAVISVNELDSMNDSVLITLARGYSLLGQQSVAIGFYSQIDRTFAKHERTEKAQLFSELSDCESMLSMNHAAFLSARSALEAIEAIRSEVIGPMRLELQKYAAPMVSRLIETAILLGPSEAEIALNATESVRARFILERFGRLRVPYPEEYDTETRMQDEALRTKANRLTLALVSDPNRMDASMLKELADTQIAEGELLARLGPYRADYVQMRLGKPLAVKAMAQILAAEGQTAVVTTYSTPDVTFVWLLDAAGDVAEKWRIDIREEDLWGAVSASRSDFQRRLSLSTALNHVVSKLLGPALGAIRTGGTLCLVATGAMLQLPITGAIVDGVRVIDKCAVVQLPSFGMAGYWRRDPRPRAKLNVLVLGDSLGDLSSARAESIEVGSRFGTNPLLRKKVTRSAVAKGIPAADLLHVACHAEYCDDDLMGSGFALADHSLFTCRDLEAITTRGSLAFLSACESGRMRVRTGNEITGLISSMMLAGFDAVIGSLWRVPDRRTRELVSNFYEALERVDVAQALRHAQLQLAHSKSASSIPYNWAAWQIVGNWNTTSTLTLQSES